MEITRQKAVINTALLRKHSWNVCYAIMVGNDDLLNLALADGLDYDELAAEIISYVDTDKDRLLFEPLMQLTDSKTIREYIESDQVCRQYDNVLRNLADTLDKLREFGNKLYRGISGQLTPFFCNDKAETLLQRSVDAGLLTEDFMPAKGTERFQLKLIATAFNAIMGYGVRDKWCHFQELWGCDFHRSIIPLTKGKAIYEIAQLYQEANLWSLVIPKTKQSKLKTDLSEKQATKLFQLLRRMGYIEKHTRVENFLSILDLSDYPYSPINWTSEGKNSLVYLAMVLFKPLNPDIHKKVCDCFTYNGHPLNYSTLNTQGSYVMKRRDKFDFVVVIDGIIALAKNEQ